VLAADSAGIGPALFRNPSSESPAMKKSFRAAIALAFSVFALLFLVPPGANAQDRRSRSGSNNNETYLVIRVTDENKAENKVEYKVVSTSQLKTEEKRVKDDYAQKLKEWHDLIKIDPQTPRPVPPVIKKYPKIFGTQKIAQEYADKLKDEEANNGDAKSKDKK
jgi:cell division protein FtsX